MVPRRQARYGPPGRERLVGLVLLAAALGGACSFVAQDDGPSALASVVVTDRIEMIQAGERPRVALRYDFSDDQVEVVSTDVIRLSQQVLSGSDPLGDTVAVPGAAAEVNVTIGSAAVVSAEPAGFDSDGVQLFAVDSDVREVSVESADSDEVAQAARSASESAVGGSSRYLVDRRGRTFAAQNQGEAGDTDVGGVEGDDLLASLGAQSGGDGAVMVGLPEEAVGIGATWLVDGVSGAIRVEVLDIATGENGSAESVRVAIESTGGESLVGEANADELRVGELTAGGLEQDDRTVSGTIDIDLSRPVHQSRVASVVTHVASAETVLEGLSGTDYDALSGDIRQTIEIVSEVQIRD